MPLSSWPVASVNPCSSAGCFPLSRAAVVLWSAFVAASLQAVSSDLRMAVWTRSVWCRSAHKLSVHESTRGGSSGLSLQQSIACWNCYNGIPLRSVAHLLRTRAHSRGCTRASTQNSRWTHRLSCTFTTLAQAYDMKWHATELDIGFFLHRPGYVQSQSLCGHHTNSIVSCELMGAYRHASEGGDTSENS
jgi:hypothetical protein